ncbi:hypothetical protein QH494_28230 [Sphingomonas sp. AR_OL41]|uniref:hypothetical protein n=1 Tax=Sphingomonas sp. AR_OL41 TaxID=3042729 RepID=UPI0024803AB6|nr:hypothetical protein [Sphingomonas sp. AR_OL41]MDH7976084.1 hypothetical protein [Sphingomonas sp. AR_OL41]
MALVILSGLLRAAALTSLICALFVPSAYSVSYLIVLAFALVTGILAYRRVKSEPHQNSVLTIGACCVVYWSLAGLHLTVVRNDIALASILALLGGSWIGLVRDHASRIRDVR